MALDENVGSGSDVAIVSRGLKRIKITPDAALMLLQDFRDGPEELLPKDTQALRFGLDANGDCWLIVAHDAFEQVPAADEIPQLVLWFSPSKWVRNGT